MDYYTQEEFESRLQAWLRGDIAIQDAFPELSDSAREFIKTGITEEEWDQIFGLEDEPQKTQ